MRQMRLVHTVDPVSLWFPYDYQRKLLYSRKRYLIALAANRVGKSDWLTTDFSLFAMGRHPVCRTPRNANLWISVLTNDKVDEVLLPKFKERLRPGSWEYNDNKKVFKVKVGANNFSTIVIKSQEAGVGSYESATVHRLAFDEQPYEEIFDAALVRVIDTGGQVLVAATMWEEGISWLYDRFVVPVLEGSNRARDIELVRASMYDNPILDRKNIDEYFRAMSEKAPEEARVRVLGEFIPLSGKCIFNTTALMRYAENKLPYKTCEMEA